MATAIKKSIDTGDARALAGRCRALVKHLKKPDLNPEILYWMIRGRHDGDVAQILGLQPSDVERHQELWMDAIYGQNARPNHADLRPILFKYIGKFGYSGGTWLNPNLLEFDSSWENSPFVEKPPKENKKEKPAIKTEKKPRRTSLLTSAAPVTSGIVPVNPPHETITSIQSPTSGAAIQSVSVSVPAKPRRSVVRPDVKIDDKQFQFFMMLAFADHGFTSQDYDSMLAREPLPADRLMHIVNKFDLAEPADKTEILYHVWDLSRSQIDVARIVDDLDYPGAVRKIGNFLGVKSKDIDAFLQVVSPTGVPIFDRVQEALPFATALNQRLKIVDQDFPPVQVAIIGGGIRRRLNGLKSTATTPKSNGTDSSHLRIQTALTDLRRQMQDRVAAKA